MAANNAYWQPFAPTDLMDTAPNLLLTQPTAATSQHLPPHPQNIPPPSSAPQPQSQPHPQQPWNNDFNRKKWNQNFGEFDINAAQTTNRFFQMEDYHSNHDPSEADSPDSGSGSSNHRRTESYPTQEPTTLSQGDQKQRRKEQNRAAQRAFRERKERYVKELQLKIKEMEKKHGEELKRVNDENERLKDLVKKMEIEIYTLKGAAMAFNMSINKLREAGLDVSHPAPPNASTTTTVHTPTTPPHQHQFTNRRPSPPVPRSSSATTTTTTSALDQLLSDSSSSVSTPVESAQSLPLRLQQRQQQRNSKGQTMFTDDELMMGDKEDNNGADEEDNDNFVERDAYRFKQHRPVDPSLLPTSSAVKMIPCSQIWERLSQHPNFDEFDLDKLCEELKKKAKCSGNGPVIPEYELQEVLRRMDNRMI